MKKNNFNNSRVLTTNDVDEHIAYSSRRVAYWTVYYAPISKNIWISARKFNKI